MKVAFVIYADTELLLEKIDTCNNNPEKSATAKTNILHVVVHYLYTAYYSFDSNKKTRLSRKRFKRTHNKCN